MIWVLIAFLIICVWVYVIRVMQSSHDHDERMRLSLLAETAAKRWPGKSYSEQLNLLARDTFKEVVRRKKSGDDISDLIDDYMLIQNERQRVWREEVESESEVVGMGDPFVEKL